MDVVAGFDVAGGEADDLVVAMRGLAFCDIAHRDLVAGGDRDDRAHVFLGDERAGGDLDARDDDVVLGVQADGQVGGLEHGTS
jgi:hypothetical protein